MMNIKCLLIASSTFFTPFVYADPVVTVNLRIKAMIVDRTCTVATESENINVDLGKWTTNNMTNIGNQTRLTPFSILLQDCSAKKVSVAFQGQKDTNNSQLLALSNNSSASNIAIRISDQNQQLLPVAQFTQPISIDSSNKIQLIFFANYVVTRNSATAGTANSTANFIVNYD